MIHLLGIYIKTTLRQVVQGTFARKLQIDYCTSDDHTLSPAYIFRLAVGYGVNKLHCEKGELAVGKILMKAGKSNAYVLISSEIHEII